MSGCLVQSLHGIAAEDGSNFVYNKLLYGQWINETNIYNIYYNPNNKTSYYWVVEENEKTNHNVEIIEFNLVNIAGSYYIDMMLTEYKGKKVHNILRIDFIDESTMYVYTFNLDKDYLQRHSKEISYENAKGAADADEFILTSDTKQLQQFISKHEELFEGNPLVFRKVKDTNNDTIRRLLKTETETTYKDKLR
ncbi:MAG: hypothetical protein L7F77_02555 [Candidatus Magnetominusculus sp. LBB02]|nr:hypothetical protein [Candidatus Magnetominusculus sp. LBB02]